MLTESLNARSITFPILVLFLNGCVNLNTVGTFAEGAQALSQASGKFYDMELETDRRFAAMTVDLGAQERARECRQENGTYMTPWDCATKGENLLSEARRNRAAVAALAQYAKSLNQIAEFNDDKNIEKASRELSGNLSSIAKTLDSAADPKEQALASAISGLAKIYLNVKARRIIYKKIILAQDDVATIVNTLRKDVRRQQQRLAVSRINANATREEWFEAFRAGYNDGGTSRSERAFLTIAAGQLVADHLQEELAAEPANLFLEQLDRTAESCLEAHKAIQNPNLRDRAGTVSEFVNDARSLLSSVNRLSS